MSPPGLSLRGPQRLLAFPLQTCLPADIQEAHQTLVAKGVTFYGEPHLVAKMPDHDLWMAFFRDPDQNLLALMCEVRG